MVAFFRHVVSKEEVKVDPHKIEGVKNCVRPNAMMKFRSFVRLDIYYRRFVKNFASIATHFPICLRRRYHLNGLKNVNRDSKSSRLSLPPRAF